MAIETVQSGAFNSRSSDSLRLARDYEVKTSHSKAFTFIAASRYMTARLTRLKAS